MNRAAPPIQVDRNSPVPLYFQVAQHLEHLIESGELAPGTRLENEIDLADRLGLSRPTMRRAIEYLVDRGLLVRKRGVGTQVVHAKVRRQVELTSLYDDLAKAQPRSAHAGAQLRGRDRLPTRSRSSSASPRERRSTSSSGSGSPTPSRSRSCATTSRPTCCASRRRTCEAQGLYNLLRANGVNLQDRQAVDRGPRRHRRRGPGAGRDQGSAAADHGPRGLRRPGAGG